MDQNNTRRIQGPEFKGQTLGELRQWLNTLADAPDSAKVWPDREGIGVSWEVTRS